MSTAAVSPDFQHVLEHAIESARAGELAQAQALLGKAMDLNPASPVPHFLQGANFAQMGQTELAEAAFVCSLARAPGFAIARFQLGLLQLTGGRSHLARATWEPLLGLGDDSHLKRFVQGFVEILLGNSASAQRFIREGMRLNTENPVLNRDMEGVLSRLSALVVEDAGARADADASEVAEAAEAADTAGAHHFLIGAYRQQ